MDGVKMSNGTNSKDKNFTKEGDDDMTTVAKTEKVDQFLTKKGDTDKVMNRFFAHKPKKGVKTPLKGKDV